MIGYATFFYKVADWHTPMSAGDGLHRGIYTPFPANGRGSPDAGFRNYSENGNYWVYAGNYEGSNPQGDNLWPGGVISYFQALRVRIIPAEEPPNGTPLGGSEVVIYKREVSNGIGNNQLLAGATFRIQGYYPGTLPNPGAQPPYFGTPAIPIDRVATTGANGRVVFGNLPPGQFTITEIQPPTGYLMGENNVWVVEVGRGQTIALGTAQAHTFFNVPKSSLEVLKICSDGVPLSDAVFELRDPATGETWQASTGINGIATFGVGSAGNFLYPGRTYILTEIQAPFGYIRTPQPLEIVLSPGNENRITVPNWRYPMLTIWKNDAIMGWPVRGAEFTIERLSPAPVGMITGNPFRTNENGEIEVGRLPPGVYRIIETRAANNYWLDPQVANRTWTITM
jgi:hypothetical protein